jgi:hypothetical protein
LEDTDQYGESTMNDDKKTPSIDAACKEIEGLDVYDDANGSAALIRVAIEFSRQELMNEGVDLWNVTNENDLHEYCRMWLKEITRREKDSKRTENDLALIALLNAIKYGVNKLIKDRKRAKNP